MFVCEHRTNGKLLRACNPTTNKLKGCFRITTFFWVIWAFSAQNAQNFKQTYRNNEKSKKYASTVEKSELFGVFKKNNFMVEFVCFPRLKYSLSASAQKK